MAVALSFFIWHECITCYNTASIYQTVYFASFAVVSVCGATASLIVLYALIPELASDSNENVELNIIYAVVYCLGHLMVYGGVWVALITVGGGDVQTEELTLQDQMVFSVTALVVIAIGVLFAVYFYVCVQEEQANKLPKLKWYKRFLDIRFYLVVSTTLQVQLTYTIPKAYLPLYLLYSLKMNKTSIAMAPLLLFFVTTCACFCVKPLNRLVGRKVLYCTNLLITCGSLAWFWLSEPTDNGTSIFNLKRDSIYGAVILLGIGNGLSWVISGSMGVDLIGKFTGSSAFFFGCQAITLHMFGGITVKVVQEAEPASVSMLPEFYRQAMVFPVLAALSIGLTSISLMACLEKWNEKQESSRITEAALVPVLLMSCYRQWIKVCRLHGTQEKRKEDFPLLEEQNGAINITPNGHLWSESECSEPSDEHK